MGSTRNTPNKAAEGPKAGGANRKGASQPAKKAPAKAPAKKAPAKAPAPRRQDGPPPATELLEVRRGNRVVLFQEVVKDATKVTLESGKISVTARTADAPAEEDVTEQNVRAAGGQPAGEPPTAEEVDAMVANAVPPNQAVVFEQDPRVITTIHDGATVAEQNDGKRA